MPQMLEPHPQQMHQLQQRSPSRQQAMQLKKGSQRYYITPKTITNQMPPTNQTETILTTHTHQNPNNHKTSHLYNTLPSATEFSRMTDKEAIKCICMILPSPKKKKNKNTTNYAHPTAGTT
jgi:hypothetical protein